MLHSCCPVMCSDEDQPIVMEIYTGFDTRNSLTILIEVTDYDNDRRECETVATVNTEDAEAMAARHRVSYPELPAFISECMSEWRDIVNPDFTEVRNCFREITECLLDERCRFKIS